MHLKKLKKSCVIGIIILFFEASVAPTFSERIINVFNKLHSTKPIAIFNRNILYVGGNGSGNYSKIQDAIDNASIGDTVFVYDDSSPYYEQILVYKSINLVGENKNTTIIDGNYNGTVIFISADNVSITNFTIQNGGLSYPDPGIYIDSSYNTISENLIRNNNVGIYLNQDSLFNNILNNIIISNGMYDSITLFYSSYNNISKNFLTNGSHGINCGGSSYNNFSENYITDNDYGIYLGNSNYNIITDNIIINNSYEGLSLWTASNNFICNNNLIDNDVYNIMLV